MSTELMKVSVQLLNGNNYSFWKTKMKAMLIKDELWDIVTEPKPQEVTSVWKKTNNKAVAYITLSLEDAQLTHIAHMEYASEIWQFLSKKYERSTYGSRLYLRRKLYNIQYKGGSMSKHIDTIMEVVGLLRGSGKPLEEEEIVAVLLISLPETFSGLVTSLEGRDEKDLTVEYVTGKMLDEFQRQEERKYFNDVNESALQVEVPRKFVRGQQGGTSNINKKVSAKPDYKKEDRTCFFCNIKGHLKADCRKFKSSNKTMVKTSVSQSSSQNFVSFNVHECHRNSNAKKWCIDSGATSHMTNDKSFFTNLQDTNTTVFLADGSSVQAGGIGDGWINCLLPSGKSQSINLKNVLFVPQLDCGLLSVQRITQHGLKVVFDGVHCKIYQNSHIVAIATNSGNLFELNTVSTAEEWVGVADATTTLHQWHRRLGHRDPTAIKRIINEDLATGIKVSDFKSEICEECIKGKLSQSKFSLSLSRESESLKLIHTDLCGPMPTKTPSGNRYFLTFIDDYSRFTVVRLVKSKDQVQGVIQEYIAAMETQFGRKPAVIRSDNGTEYIPKELENFLNKQGIKHEYTVPYTPQQNGVAERKNRSLTESAKCMLLDAKLDNCFWGEAVLTAAYLQNRTPSRVVEKTPVELFTGKKPDLGNIRVFGSKVFSYIPKEKRRKFDDKAQEGVLIGFDEHSKGYRILNPKTKQVWISRSVRIIEQTGNPRNVKPKGEISTQLSTEYGSFTVEMGNEDCSNEESTLLELNTSDPINVQTDSSEVDTSVSGNNLRVSQRRNKGEPPIRYGYKVGTITYNKDPNSWEQVMELPSRERKHWLAAAEEEIESLKEHKVWTLCDLPPGKKTISCKWVFKTKFNGNGQIDSYKARLVARGFSQRYGEDYDETFAPVVKHETIRVLLAIAAKRKLHVRHMDVKNAYLNGEIDEEIFMEQPPGFVEIGQECKVLKLQRSLYGLKQSARAWNKTANQVLEQLEFKRGYADTCLYSRKEKDGQLTYILLYVDDLLIAGSSPNITCTVGKELNKYFKTKDLGEVSHYLGIQIEREEDGSFLLNQRSKISRMLEDYGLTDSKPTMTPMETNFLSSMTDDSKKLTNNKLYRQAVGSLLYIATVSRPDIAASIGFLCRCVESPTENHWKAVKRVIRYLATTIDKCLRLSSTSETDLVCFVDADWAGSRIDRKSTTGYVFQLGGCTIAWTSRKQSIVALSSTEAEYVSASEASKELLWLRQLMSDMSIPINETITMFEDNQGCIKIINSDKFGARTKHIDICHHHIRDLSEKKIIDVKYCPTSDMLADVLTKPLPKDSFQKFRGLLGIY